MKVFRTRHSFQQWRRSFSSAKKLGFVPTMGALHDGHLSLVRKAKRECDAVVVSIFVNPTQFGPHEDFNAYPRTLENDLRLLRRVGVDVVFAPKDAKQLYPRDSDIRVLPRRNLSEPHEGAFRPGHFEGVATVVLKLFHLCRPSAMYFGEKDFQQLEVIRAMAADLFLDVTIRSGKTIREKSGLARSSRNVYLSASAKERAALIYQVLRTAKDPAVAKKQLQKAGIKVDYLAEWRGRWIVAARVDNVRLIDNIKRSV